MDTVMAMRAFVAVVQSRGFTRAAEQMQLSPQLVSKYVAQLEDHLGARLLQRTTRKVSLTEAGAVYFERCQQVLADIEDMENALDTMATQVKGVLRLSAPMSFGARHLVQALVGFRDTYPDVEIDLHLNDRRVDLVEEGFDLVLRIGRLKDSALVAKRLAPIRLVHCASPQYLATKGVPSSPEDLLSHQYLGYHYMDAATFQGAASPLVKIFPKLKSVFRANNGDVLAQAAIWGQGIALLPTFIVGCELAEQKLQRVLMDYEPPEIGLYAVYAHRRHLSSKVQCFVNYLCDYFAGDPSWDKGVFC